MENNQPVRQAPVVVKEKTKSRPAVVVLSVLFLLALVSIGVLAYMWLQQRQAVTDKSNELALTKEALVGASRDDIATAQANQESEKIPDFGKFLTAYNAILEGGDGLNISRSQEDAAIKQALRDYYQAQTLPEGLAVLSIYQVVKPQTPPSGDYYALVYYPASDKPASFVSLIKPKGGSWKYHELR